MALTSAAGAVSSPRTTRASRSAARAATLDDDGVAHRGLRLRAPGARGAQGVAKALLAGVRRRARERGRAHDARRATTNEVGRDGLAAARLPELALRTGRAARSLESRLAGAPGRRLVRRRSTSRPTTPTRSSARSPSSCRASALGADDGRRRRGTAGSRSTTSSATATARRASGSRASSSNATGAVVCTLGVEEGAVVRYVLYDRGSIADEYPSVPEYYGPLPPGDVVALGANPTVVARLTGADRTASARSPARRVADELPPAPRAARPDRRGSASRAPGAGSLRRCHALRRRPLPLLRPRADRARREGARATRRSRSTSPTGRPGSTRRTRSARCRSTRRTACRPARVGGDHGVPRGALPGAGAAAGRPGGAGARRGSGSTASTTCSATTTTPPARRRGARAARGAARRARRGSRPSRTSRARVRARRHRLRAVGAARAGAARRRAGPAGLAAWLERLGERPAIAAERELVAGRMKIALLHALPFDERMWDRSSGTRGRALYARLGPSIDEWALAARGRGGRAARRGRRVDGRVHRRAAIARSRRSASRARARRVARRRRPARARGGARGVDPAHPRARAARGSGRSSGQLSSPTDADEDVVERAARARARAGSRGAAAGDRGDPRPPRLDRGCERAGRRCSSRAASTTRS